MYGCEGSRLVTKIGSRDEEVGPEKVGVEKRDIRNESVGVR